MRSSDLTIALEAANRGDSQAAAQLLPLVYDELHQLARSRLAGLPPGQTLQATALVHEAYLRLVGSEDPGWKNLGHFFGAAARAMRNILIDQARRKGRARHGGDRQREALTPDLAFEHDLPVEDLLQLDAALERLEQIDPRRARVVMLRFFAGLDDDAIAEILDCSPRTIARDWRFARSWLRRELDEGCPDVER